MKIQIKIDPNRELTLKIEETELSKNYPRKRHKPGWFNKGILPSLPLYHICPRALKIKNIFLFFLRERITLMPKHEDMTKKITDQVLDKALTNRIHHHLK